MTGVVVGEGVSDGEGVAVAVSGVAVLLAPVCTVEVAVDSEVELGEAADWVGVEVGSSSEAEGVQEAVIVGISGCTADE